MSNGAKIAIVVLIAALIAAGGIFMATQGGNDSPTKNSGKVMVSVTNTYITSVPIQIYIDGELVQDTTASPYGNASGQKKVTWNAGQDRYNVTVKVVYKPGSAEKTLTRNVMVAKGGTELVTISI